MNSRALATVKRGTPALPSGRETERAPDGAERVSITAKLWLTPAEAQAYSGLGEAYLAGLVKAGKIVGVKGGPHGSWVLHRRSLEGYAGG